MNCSGKSFDPTRRVTSWAKLRRGAASKADPSSGAATAARDDDIEKLLPLNVRGAVPAREPASDGRILCDRRGEPALHGAETRFRQERQDGDRDASNQQEGIVEEGQPGGDVAAQPTG